MSKLEEAKNILKELKVPLKQQSDLCGYVILAMADIKKNDKWAKATNKWIRIHEVIAFIRDFYEVSYAENSRETFRKQAMHHFRNAAFIEDNGTATNSPNYRYRLTDEMLLLVKIYQSSQWEEHKNKFLKSHQNLIDLYSSKKEVRKMPVKILSLTVSKVKMPFEPSVLQALRAFLFRFETKKIVFYFPLLCFCIVLI